MRAQRLFAWGMLALVGGISAGCWDAYSEFYDPLTKHTTGGAGGGTTTTTVDPGCIASSKTDPVDNDCGLFVSSSKGADTNPGTKEAPLKTLSKALGTATGKPIYLCGETFAEAVEIKAGALMYGALDCTADWAYVKEKRTSIAPSTEPVALRVTSKATLEMFDVDVTSPAATAPGSSSVGVFAESETELRLTRSHVTAGDGAAGADGEVFVDPATQGNDGQSGADACTAASTNGGNSVPNACDAETSVGGKGGSSDEFSGGPGGPGLPDGTMNGGAGEGGVACTTGTAGDPGTSGTSGAGASGVGTLTSSGYEGVAGLDGKPGKLGQGGGGGGGAKGGSMGNACNKVMNAPGNGGASGASGGAGGCGGAGGRGGGGGGASIGVVSLGATLLFESITITSSKGGRGGNGGAGQSGGSGGNGTSGGKVPAGATDLKPGCASGAGGKGGDGGLGGGGLGGPSLGVAYIGAVPSTTGATIQIGTPGKGGTGDGATGTGAEGVAAQMQAF